MNKPKSITIHDVTFVSIDFIHKKLEENPDIKHISNDKLNDLVYTMEKENVVREVILDCGEIVYSYISNGSRDSVVNQVKEDNHRESYLMLAIQQTVEECVEGKTIINGY